MVKLLAFFTKRKSTKKAWVDSAMKIIDDQNRINEHIKAGKDLKTIKNIKFVKPV